MKRLMIAFALPLLLVAGVARAERPAAGLGVDAGVSSGDLKATPEMWFYDQAMRQYKDPKMAVRAKAEYCTQQRMRRLESMKWFGFSNSRPTASSDPYHGDYSPQLDRESGLLPLALERRRPNVVLLLRLSLVFAPRQVVQRVQIEELEEAVGSAVVRGPPLGVRPLDPQQSAADQVGENVAAGFAPQAAQRLGGKRLLVGHQRQHVDGGLRQAGLADAAIEAVAQRLELAAEQKPVAVSLADDLIRRLWAS